MRLRKRLLSTLLAFVMISSLLQVVTFADAVSRFKIENITYTDDSMTPSAKVSNISEIVYSIDGVVQTREIPSNQQATLVVDGNQYDIVEGKIYEFTKDADIILTIKDDINKDTNVGPGGMHTYYFKSAAFLNEGNLLRANIEAISLLKQLLN